jgi:hypothetical protein
VTETAQNDDPFTGIQESHAADYMLRNVQQHLVSLSAQADLKASVVMTVSALLMGAAATGADKKVTLWGIVPFSIGLAVTLLWSVLAIMPRKGSPREKDDLLFFGDIANLSRRNYQERMAALLTDDGGLYQAMVDNLHDHSVFLVKEKYRYLRHSYLWFMLAFLAGAVGIVADQLFS